MLHSNSSAVALNTSSAPPSSMQCNLIDDSLTDIRWLGSMDGRMNFPSMEQSNYRQRHSSNHLKSNGKGRICKKLNYTKKDSKTDAHKIRPPFSYAALIALAINSDPQRMLTLNSIYQWIENNFPFFRLPEARAWKNSIRHNLSIKKNLFQKVYIDPPRRSNGAYWTLLNEGIDEVERCMKLFTTLRPPVIDKSSMYYTDNNPSQQVVRSRGQFMPAMNGDEEETLSGINSPFNAVTVIKEELITAEDEEDDNDTSDGMLHNATLTNELPILPAAQGGSSAKLRHPLEYSREYSTRAYPPSIQPFNGPLRTTSSTIAHSGFYSNDHSNSSFPDLSFLTPMKTDVLSSGNGGGGSENNFLTSPSMTPQSNKHSYYHGPPNQSYSPLCTPLKPLLLETTGGVADYGVFSPSNFQFCTPIKDINELLQLSSTNEADCLYNQYDSTTPSQYSKSQLHVCSLNANPQF